MKPATSLCCLRRSVATRRCTNTNPTTASTVATATNKRPVRTRIIENLLPEHACSLDRSFRRRRNMMPKADARRELRRTTLPRTPVHKAVGSPGLLLAVDLDEQHPRVDQSRYDREERAHHQPVEPSRPNPKHGETRDHHRQRADLAQHHPKHEGDAQVGPHGPPLPQPRQLDGHDPYPGGESHHEHLRTEQALPLS